MPRNLYADRPHIYSSSPKEPPKSQRESALGETVLENLGTPDALHRVEVKELYDSCHYRINVYQWVKNKSLITDSFYVVITPDGVMSSPPMIRKYYDDLLAIGDFEKCKYMENQ